VFAKAREKARQTTCSSNLKQIGIGLIQYIQDNDELYPCGVISGTPSPTSGVGAGWAGAVNTYVKSTKVWTCPDDVTVPASTAVAGTLTVSYGMNCYLGGLNSATMIAPATTVQCFEVTGDVAPLNYPDEGTKEAGAVSGWIVSAVGDGWGYNCCGWTGDYTNAVNCTAAGVCTRNGLGSNPVFNPALGGTYARHDVQSNGLQGHSMYLMADGHVKWISTQNVGCLGNAPPSNNALGAVSTWAYGGGTCGPFVATFNPQ
jgi:prepilin-type processing-associated H-X9-DG protein